MQESDEKRNVPQGLKALLAKDVELTNYFIRSTQHLTLFRSLKIHHKLLEVFIFSKCSDLLNVKFDSIISS